MIIDFIDMVRYIRNISLIIIFVSLLLSSYDVNASLIIPSYLPYNTLTIPFFGTIDIDISQYTHTKLTFEIYISGKSQSGSETNPQVIIGNIDTCLMNIYNSNGILLNKMKHIILPWNGSEIRQHESQWYSPELILDSPVQESFIYFEGVFSLSQPMNFNQSSPELSFYAKFRGREYNYDVGQSRVLIDIDKKPVVDIPLSSIYITTYDNNNNNNISLHNNPDSVTNNSHQDSRNDSINDCSRQDTRNSRINNSNQDTLTNTSINISQYGTLNINLVNFTLEPEVFEVIITPEWFIYEPPTAIEPSTCSIQYYEPGIDISNNNHPPTYIYPALISTKHQSSRVLTINPHFEKAGNSPIVIGSSIHIECSDILIRYTAQQQRIDTPMAYINIISQQGTNINSIILEKIQFRSLYDNISFIGSTYYVSTQNTNNNNKKKNIKSNNNKKKKNIKINNNINTPSQINPYDSTSNSLYIGAQSTLQIYKPTIEQLNTYYLDIYPNLPSFNYESNTIDYTKSRFYISITCGDIESYQAGYSDFIIQPSPYKVILNAIDNFTPLNIDTDTDKVKYNDADTDAVNTDKLKDNDNKNILLTIPLINSKKWNIDTKILDQCIVDHTTGQAIIHITLDIMYTFKTTPPAPTTAVVPEATETSTVLSPQTKGLTGISFALRQNELIEQLQQSIVQSSTSLYYHSTASATSLGYDYKSPTGGPKDDSSGSGDNNQYNISISGQDTKRKDIHDSISIAMYNPGSGDIKQASEWSEQPIVNTLSEVVSSPSPLPSSVGSSIGSLFSPAQYSLNRLDRTQINVRVIHSSVTMSLSKHHCDHISHTITQDSGIFSSLLLMKCSNVLFKALQDIKQINNMVFTDDNDNDDESIIEALFVVKLPQIGSPLTKPVVLSRPAVVFAMIDLPKLSPNPYHHDDGHDDNDDDDDGHDNDNDNNDPSTSSVYYKYISITLSIIVVILLIIVFFMLIKLRRSIRPDRLIFGDSSDGHDMSLLNLNNDVQL